MHNTDSFCSVFASVAFALMLSSHSCKIYLPTQIIAFYCTNNFKNNLTCHISNLSFHASRAHQINEQSICTVRTCLHIIVVLIHQQSMSSRILVREFDCYCFCHLIINDDLSYSGIDEISVNNLFPVKS